MEIKQNYHPESDKKIRGDPHKTVIVAKLNYKTDEATLERQFDIFGDIRRVRVVKDIKTGKSRGYAFIEFQDSRGAESAYRKGNGRRIDGVNVIVDRELARTDKYWLPKRLGGGKGGDSRRNRDEEAYIREIRKDLRE
jgi:U1 small nuclear ribonucleoprotein